MTVREYIEQNKEKFLGYTIRVCDCDGYELLTFRMKQETDLNINLYDDADDDDPQLILTSNCEL